MFEEYLHDASYFISEARRFSREGDEEAARRSYRVAAMVGGAAMETFVNYLASTFEAAPDTLEPYELALLVERRFGQQDGVFGIQDRIAYSRLEDKIRFLIHRFAVDIDLSTSSAWPHFLRFKRLRDSLVHSKEDADERPVAEYDKACTDGIRGSFLLMNKLSQGVFKRPLRAKLHDLADFAST